MNREMMHEPAPLLVSGIIRSGTTLLSRILNAHPRMSVFSDPYSGFFIELRNEVARVMFGETFDPQKPLSHGFFESDTSLKTHLRECSLNIPIPPSRLPEVLERVRSFAVENVPSLEKDLVSLNADNFHQLFKQLLAALQRVTQNQNGNLEYIGFKQAWAEELLSPVLRSCPDLKVVHIIRDPRAVIASRKKGSQFLSHRYPLLFILRHWRKSFAYALYLQDKFPSQFRWITYEDLVSAPEKSAKSLCEFLNLSFAESMLDVSSFENNNKQPWTDNSAYGGFRSISSDSMERWKEQLSEEELQYIEDFTHLELELLQRPRLTALALEHSSTKELELDPPDTPWMIKYGKEEDSLEQRRERELQRLSTFETLLSKEEVTQKNMLESLFIVPEFASLIQRLQKTP